MHGEKHSKIIELNAFMYVDISIQHWHCKKSNQWKFHIIAMNTMQKCENWLIMAVTELWLK